MKLNVLLAKTDQLSAIIKANITDTIDKFKNKQTLFRGERKAFKERSPEFADPTQILDKQVHSTVEETLGYLFKLTHNYLSAKLDQEATNCSGLAKAELIINNESYGEFTTGELMALKGFFEQQIFKDMLGNMPTMSLAERWTKCNTPEYASRAVYENPLQQWVAKQTEIYEVPHFDPQGKQPAVIVKEKKTIEVADLERQLYTGEVSHIDKAYMIARLSELSLAIKEALEKANEAEVIKSKMNIKRLFRYLQTGK
jgi:hypothetical protein